MSKLLDKYNIDESISYDVYEEESLVNLKFNLDNIEKVQFIKCKFQNVTFRDLYLGETTFQNCEFTNCYFINVNLTKVKFLDSKLTDVVFDDGKMFNIEMIDSLIQYCHFSINNIIDGVFNSRFISCFFHTSLAKCDFKNSEFVDWQIENLNCDKVLFDKCKIENLIGDINNFKGSTISMAQAMDFVMGIGIDIKEFEN